MSKPSRIAVVTGSSRGIGRAIAGKLAASGWSLALTHYEDGEAAGRTLEDLRQGGARVECFEADLAQKPEVSDLFSRIESALGSPDILVNNAGITPKVPFLEAGPEIWNRTLATNLLGPAYCAQEVIPGMLDRGKGRIVNIASVHAERTARLFSVYAASKGGLQALTRALASEFGPFGITCNCLLVGAIRTERTAGSIEDPERRAVWSKLLPVGRWGSMREVASAAAFLAGDEASYVNGASLRVDGGAISYAPQVDDFIP